MWKVWRSDTDASGFQRIWFVDYNEPAQLALMGVNFLEPTSGASA